MTKEEAIKRLYEMQFYSACKAYESESMAKFWNDSVYAIDIAIAALSEQDVTDTNVGNKWISVEERLPAAADANPYESILAIEKDDGFARAWCWDIVVRYPNEFTHWMPLPEPPEVSHG